MQRQPAHGLSSASNIEIMKKEMTANIGRQRFIFAVFALVFLLADWLSKRFSKDCFLFNTPSMFYLLMSLRFPAIRAAVRPHRNSGRRPGYDRVPVAPLAQAWDGEIRQVGLSRHESDRSQVVRNSGRCSMRTGHWISSRCIQRSWLRHSSSTIPGTSSPIPTPGASLR